ncbi:hypothetical protein VTH06DRAFT_6189, partial [Thermothelomyces fergusii]
MSLSSLCHRAARPSLLGTPVPRLSFTGPSTTTTTTTTTRHASLSAINKGLVRSEQARPQGPRPEKLSELAAGGKRMTYAERREARERLAEEKPAFRILKGKKDITENPGKTKPKSRQARFYDPESPFGKKSLVYQLQTGKLSEELKTLVEKAQTQTRTQKSSSSSSSSSNNNNNNNNNGGGDGGGSGGDLSESPFETSVPRPDLKPPRSLLRKSARERRRGRNDDDTGDVVDFVAEFTKGAGLGRDGPRGDGP